MSYIESIAFEWYANLTVQGFAVIKWKENRIFFLFQCPNMSSCMITEMRSRVECFDLAILCSLKT